VTLGSYAVAQGERAENEAVTERIAQHSVNDCHQLLSASKMRPPYWQDNVSEIFNLQTIEAGGSS
jgi:hypothetical protein